MREGLKLFAVPCIHAPARRRGREHDARLMELNGMWRALEIANPMAYQKARAWYMLVAIAETYWRGALAIAYAPTEIDYSEGNKSDASAGLVERFHDGQQHAWEVHPQTLALRQSAAANVTHTRTGLRVNIPDAPQAEAPPPAAASVTTLGTGLRVNNFTTPGNKAPGALSQQSRTAIEEVVAAAKASRMADEMQALHAGSGGGASRGSAMSRAANVTQPAAVEGKRARHTAFAAATGRQRHADFALFAKPAKTPLGLPMLFWALLADAVAMLGFAACIPIVLTAAKRKRLPCC